LSCDSVVANGRYNYTKINKIKYSVPFLNASTIPKQKFSTLSYQEFNLLEHFGGGIRNTLLSFPVSACISACP